MRSCVKKRGFVFLYIVKMWQGYNSWNVAVWMLMWREGIWESKMEAAARWIGQ